MLKDVVVNLSGRGPRDFAADYATSIAAAFGARIAGISFLYEPVIPDGTLGGIPVDLIELQREENSKIAKDAVSRFEAGAKKAGISAETRILDATFGGAATLFAQIARRFDLAAVGQAQREGGASDDLLVEGALFESGRPIVVVPYIQKRGMTLERVLACWDGGRTAARAIGDAMPFLERAKAVDIVIVAEERKSDEVSGANMSEHLTRHGVAASVKRIAKGDLAIEDVLLSYAADSGADFMVMGGYGHSRLREFILGGVTRHPGVDDRAGDDVALSAVPPQAFDGPSFSPRELRRPDGVIWPPFSPCCCVVRIASTVAGSARWSAPWTMPSQKDRKCKAYEWPVHSRSESKRNISWSTPRRSRSRATCRRPSSKLPRLRPTAESRPSSCSRRSR